MHAKKCNIGHNSLQNAMYLLISKIAHLGSTRFQPRGVRLAKIPREKWCLGILTQLFFFNKLCIIACPKAVPN